MSDGAAGSLLISDGRLSVPSFLCCRKDNLSDGLALVSDGRLSVPEGRLSIPEGCLFQKVVYSRRLSIPSSLFISDGWLSIPEGRLSIKVEFV